MGDPLILQKEKLPISYEISDLDVIKNPFFERFGRFEDPYEEFVDVCLNNLTFAVFNLMKWKGKPLELAPFQSVILQTLWDKTFPILLMTRGGGKSFMLAVYALLRAILVQGSKIVIVAASFRQSKVVFDYILKIYESSPLIQAAVTNLSKQNDSWEMVIGDSTIKALPLGNGEKIRGIRATDIICDEYASIPEEIFQVVVRGFAAVSADPIEAAKLIALEDERIRRGEMTEADRRRIVGNKIIYSGTASYRFNHYWKLYSIHKLIIDNKFIGDAKEINGAFKEDDGIKLEGNLDYRDYAIIQVPYTGIPRGFMDEKQINQAYATMPKALFSMEYECMFPNDSDGFFKRSSINAATPGLENDGTAFGIELSGDPNYEYVMGIDPARKTDNLAIAILKLMRDGTYRNVYCESMRNKNWVDAMYRIRALLKKFNIVRIAVDQGGGGTTVEDLLQRPELASNGEPLIWRFNEVEHRRYEGLHILDMVNFTPTWIAEANYGMAADIEHLKLLFPYRNLEVDVDETTDPIWDEMDEQINEMCMITVTATKTGVQHFDLPEIQTEASINLVQRKDRYSALLLASYAARSYMIQGMANTAPEAGFWADYL